MPSLAGSELAKLRGEPGPGLAEPPLDSAPAWLGAIREAVRSGEISACHDISEGGAACALAEMAIAGRLGASSIWPGSAIRTRRSSARAAADSSPPGRRALRTHSRRGLEVRARGRADGDRITLSANGESAGVSVAEARQDG